MTLVDELELELLELDVRLTNVELELDEKLELLELDELDELDVRLTNVDELEFDDQEELELEV